MMITLCGSLRRPLTIVKWWPSFMPLYLAPNAPVAKALLEGKENTKNLHSQWRSLLFRGFVPLSNEFFGETDTGSNTNLLTLSRIGS